LTRIILIIGLLFAVCRLCAAEPTSPSVQPATKDVTDLALAALWSAGDELWHMGEHTRYIEVLQAITELDPTQMDAYSDAAWLLWSQGRQDEALQTYTKATQALPDKYQPWLDLAIYYRHHLKDDQMAKEMFLEAIRISPHPNYIERQLAYTYEDLGEIPEAFNLWQELAANFPTDVAIKHNFDGFRQRHGL